MNTMLTLLPVAEEYFSFLESEFEFRKVTSEPDLLRYETDDVFVQIVYDSKRSLEINLTVGKVSTSSNANDVYTLREIVSLQDAAIAEHMQLTQESQPDVLAAVLEQMSTMLRRYGSNVLTGRSQSFAALKSQSIRLGDVHAIGRDIATARALVEKAWAEHDYATIVNAFEPFRLVLDQAEMWKLDWAQRHLNDVPQA